MNIILCHPQDNEAIWLYTELKKNGMFIELLSPEQLLLSDWTQEISTDSESFEIETKSGLTLFPGNINLLINRTTSVNPIAWKNSDPKEKNYVQAELNAMLMAWLFQVNQKTRVLNPTVGYSLSGVTWKPNEWIKAGFQAGFDASNYGNALKHGVSSLLVNGEIITSLSTKTELLNKGQVLASISQTPLLEIVTDSTGTQLLFASTFPAFTSYGPAIVQLLSISYG